MEPEPSYYVTKETAANISCEAYNVSWIAFACVGEVIPQSAITTYQWYEEEDEATHVLSTIHVTRSHVVQSKDGEYWCECMTISDNLTSVSRRAVVTSACK